MSKSLDPTVEPWVCDTRAAVMSILSVISDVPDVPYVCDAYDVYDSYGVYEVPDIHVVSYVCETDHRGR